MALEARPQCVICSLTPCDVADFVHAFRAGARERSLPTPSIFATYFDEDALAVANPSLVEGVVTCQDHLGGICSIPPSLGTAKASALRRGLRLLLRAIATTSVGDVASDDHSSDPSMVRSSTGCVLDMYVAEVHTGRLALVAQSTTVAPTGLGGLI